MPRFTKALLVLVITALLASACGLQTSATLPTRQAAEKTALYQANLPIVVQAAAAPPETGVEQPLSPTSAPLPPPLVETATPQPTPDLIYSGPALERTGEQTPPEKWRDWPVIPAVSDRAREIYAWGLAHGRDPNRFSKIGDCQVIRQYFLGLYEDPNNYNLGPYYELEPAIEHFQGSWYRLSDAVRTGFNVASVLTAINANPETCQPNEIPIDCEFRNHNPSIAIISMETWTPDRPTELYGQYLRQIVEISIANGVLPIISTKADNLEGDHSINLQVAQIAYEYDIPMWNFWAAADPLPNHGLMEDGFHLTNFINHYNRADAMENAWPWRNLTALQTIDHVWREVSE